MVFRQRIVMNIRQSIVRPPAKEIRQRNSASIDEIEIVGRDDQHPRQFRAHAPLFSRHSRRNIQSAAQEKGNESASHPLKRYRRLRKGIRANSWSR